MDISDNTRNRGKIQIKSNWMQRKGSPDHQNVQNDVVRDRVTGNILSYI